MRQQGLVCWCHPVLIEASVRYNLGLFFEQPVDLPEEATPDLPHQLSGAWDGALTLDSLDFSPPDHLYSRSKAKQDF